MAFPSGSPQSLRRLAAYVARVFSRSAANRVDIALAAGAANVMGFTVTVTDEEGVTVPGVHQVDIWASESNVGLGLTTAAYSGNLVAATGVILAEPTAKKRWTILTAANGVFTGSLTDTAKPQNQYIAAKNPLGSALSLSAISAGRFG